MTSTSRDLGWLLAPLTPQRFFRTHYGRSILHLGGRSPEYYAHLMTMKDVDALMVAARGGMADLRIARNGVDETNLHYRTVQQQPDDVAFMGAIYGAYAGGATLNIQFIDRRVPTVGSLCHSLRSELEHPVDAGLYLTPPGAQGLPVHVDAEDVLVLQIHGKKTWHFFDHEGGRRLEKFVPPPEGAAPSKVVELGPGDLLYVPGGIKHRALTSDGPSLHITLALRLVRWVDLLVDALHAWGRREPRLRAAVPPRYLSSASAKVVVDATYRALVREFARSGSVAEATERHARRFALKTDPTPDGYFDRLTRLEAIDDDTVLEQRDPYRRLRVVGDRVVLGVTGHVVDAPAKLLPALRLVARGRPFAVRKLPGREAVRRATARELVTRGIVRIAEAEEASRRRDRPRASRARRRSG